MAINNGDSNDERRKLYLAVLNGDWKFVENMDRIQTIITDKGATTLHIAAAANQEDFVKNLVKKLSEEELEVENYAENTALSYAAATGNVNIAMAMLEKNSRLANLGKVKPLSMAASLGHSEMVDYLYEKTEVHKWEEDEKAKLFITCVEGNLYGIAMKILKDNSDLAKPRKENEETVLHVLARKPSAFVSETRPWLKLKQENSKQIQAKELFEDYLQAYRVDAGNSSMIEHVLFYAAEEGNIECVIMLIRFDFDLLWKTKNGKSIFHVAAEKRHESIFYLLNEIGSIGDMIIDSKTENANNILHLAAELAPKEKLNAISGAALQMQREMLWFKEVEKIVPPVFKEMKNGNKETPYVVFARTHEELRTKGERWMIDTANYSMVVATLIGSTMFSGLIADGLDRSSKHYLAFSVASAISLFSSSTSLVMFLSILTSRYSYNDFVLWLPLRLLIGIASLCISIAAMMVAFFISFMLANHNGKELPVIFAVIGLFAIAPIIYGVLKWYLFIDIARSTFFRFKPRQRLLYKEMSNEPASLAIESDHCINLACIK
ncbi:uncharacterized protein LOC115976899 isoform X2 [Quercus lobata]|uniref:uncharacterized protein LOC115976899 isoform X2 n=1 Tax=Quercus lobata TaxID=97700 RepID=UPI0012465485|nr:uncharacterized protein LOC115976899 isoform X2 [Quercus lobata]XP_030954300.1 uncharacterized protein LOC115976899 isoform X2 [Quercus lobata]XP_030954301.1 uncharacterized protein LOC115976899 isoform X2 [Quercus lobata]XP_030954302.1 uncharacterized protein LOC115976899 isoform X2 [Quercus lobata]